jgi:hypothetical protein
MKLKKKWNYNYLEGKCNSKGADLKTTNVIRIIFKKK